MIALAVADKPMVRNLLSAGKLTVDYLETSGPFVPSAVESFSGPMLLHNSLWDWSLAHPNALEHENALTVTLKALALTRSPWFSVHLGFSAALVGYDDGMKPRSAVLTREQAYSAICRNIGLLKNAIGVPLIIENLDYIAGGAYEYICEPDFITAVIRETGVGLLLDIAHARVSASNLGCAFEDYLAQLPLGQVKQLHISSPRWQGNALLDVHEALIDEDYAILDIVLARTDPLALTLEYGRDADALLEQVARLKDIFDGR